MMELLTELKIYQSLEVKENRRSTGEEAPFCQPGFNDAMRLGLIKMIDVIRWLTWKIFEGCDQNQRVASKVKELYYRNLKEGENVQEHCWKK